MIKFSENDFAFKTDKDSRNYFGEIIEKMMIAHSITKIEALDRINSSWSHVDEVTGEDDLIYHEMPKYWANHFYYDKGSFWWITGEERKKQGLDPLKPLPYK